MAVRATVSRFPLDSPAHEASGLPWGIVVTPFAVADERGHPPVRGSGGSLVPRCDQCFGYISPACELERWAWNCALCGALVGYDAANVRRYEHPGACTEVTSTLVDLDMPDDESKGGGLEARPVYVAAVDLACSEEFLELIKNALLAALEALTPGSLFGLFTFSHKIGLYDVQGPIPVVKNVFIPPDADDGLNIELEDVMPLLSFLAPVSTCKDRIAAALETLRPTTSWERGAVAGQDGDTVFLGGRGFGTAMSSLVDYLGSEFGSTFALARVFAFLSGAPDYGAGQLDTRRYGEQYASKGEDADLALLPEQTPFYKDLAAVAVQAGVCVDIIAVTDEYIDLASLKFLCIESGGSLFLHSNTEDSTLPQDLYRMLSQPYAFNCLLRLRTSTDFKPGSLYGHYYPDHQYENVQHIICCDSFATYAYDFAFTHPDGFSRHAEPAIIQVAFQYSVLEPVEKLVHESNSTSSHKFCVKRRLRIRTVQYGIARDMIELYDSADTEVVLSLLVHKVIVASLDKGIREGRILLHDWLVILMAQYNDACRTGSRRSEISDVDIYFTQCRQLQSLPRLVFALLRNPLFRLHEEGIHPDYRIYFQCLFSALEPSSLVKAVYPVMTSYASLDKQAYPRHSLSHAALTSSGSPIFLLDAFTNLIVYYIPGADPSLPFPPPHDCLLRETINKLKQERCITPKVSFIHGGKDDPAVFENYLLEEQEVDGSLPTVGTGYVSFLDTITQDVVQAIKEGIES